MPELRYLELYTVTTEGMSDTCVNTMLTFSYPNLRSLALREMKALDSSPQESPIIISYINDPHPHSVQSFYEPTGEKTCGYHHKKLFIREHLSQGRRSALNVALEALAPAMVEGIEVLVVDYTPCSHLFEFDVQKFLPASLLPSLTSVSFKTVSSLCWKYIIEYFANHSGHYPGLTSLEIVGTTELFPMDRSHRNYADFAKGFPHLRRLTLNSANSNAFIKQLSSPPLPNLDSSTTLEAPYPFPEFEVFSIRNDANVSKPLLTRMIASREKMDKPLKKLLLDRHFSANKESWNYIKGLVDVSEI
ncbi:hypothetical protein CPB84DRAFT_1852868 [Gymnopilus junonius]|uniref:Uncharacterized protein n=1 Tax=Gymnopilus junonius TaxID=109634 RepID=A0A9P5ND96_GYMJU|nr:hypothetical protein CPB84DRAFT_1852868 [Gymnopilus junonius]